MAEPCIYTHARTSPSCIKGTGCDVTIGTQSCRVGKLHHVQSEKRYHPQHEDYSVNRRILILVDMYTLHGE